MRYRQPRPALAAGTLLALACANLALPQMAAAWPGGRTVRPAAQRPSESFSGIKQAQPAAPDKLTVSAQTGKSIRLNWRDNAANETAQEVWYSVHGQSFVKLATVKADTTSLIFENGRKPSGQYRFTVRSLNDFGTSRFSPVAVFGKINPEMMTAQPGQTPTFAVAVLKEVNRFREQNGLAPLKIDERLTRAAQAHSEDMAKTRAIGHTGSNGKTPDQRMSDAGYRWRAIAENVAMGQETPEEVVRDWINSPGHRANMLKADLKDVGIGYIDQCWTLDLAG